MESTFASRVRQYRQGKGLSQQAFAGLCGLTQGNIAHMENGTEPKQSNVSKLLAGLPDLNPDWLLVGTGPMLRGGRTLTSDEPTRRPPPPAAPAAAASAPPLSGEVLDKLLNQINTAAQQHREELAALKREHRQALNAQARTAQYNMDAMYAKIHYMEGRLGLRAPTPEETYAQKTLEAPATKKIGLKHYDESGPTGRLVGLFGARPLAARALRGAA